MPGMIDNIERKLDNRLIAIALVAVLAVVVYCNSFTVPFILDDFGSISNNYAIRNPLDIVSMWKFYSNRIVLYFTLSLNYALHDTAVVGYHIVNTAIHIANGILVLLIINLILSLNYFENLAISRYRGIISTLSAMIFVCHPVQVNAVTYIVQRTASLAALFYLLCVFMFLKFRTTGKARFFIFTMVFTILAMFTKENTITIPFLLLLLEILFYHEYKRITWKKRILIFLPLFLTVAIIPATNLFLNGYSQSDPDVTFKASTSMDRFHYFYTQLNVVMHYIRLLFLPYGLNFDYSNDYPISKTIWENYSYISFLGHAAIILFGMLNLKNNKLIALGIMWFYIGLSVESSFISIKDVYFEHRLYFPIIGYIIFLIGIIFITRRKSSNCYLIRKPLSAFIALSIIMVISYSAITLYRNYIFSDGIRLWSDVAKKAPASDRAHCVLATDYLNAYEENNDLKEYLELAEIEFKKAIDLYYNNSTAHCNLSKVYLLKGEYEKCIEEARKTNNISKSEYAYHNIGQAYRKMGKNNEAIQAFLEGYKLDNRCTFILKALGNTYYDIGDYKNARKYFEEFLKYNIYSDNEEIRQKLNQIKEHEAKM